MGLLNDIGSVLQQYKGASASAPPPNVAEDFGKIADQAPQSALSGALSDAFRSGSTPPFGQMVSQLFAQSDGSQRAGILNHLLAAAGPAVGSAGALGGLTSMLSGGGGRAVTADQAQQIHPDDVRQLAEQAEKRDPSVIDRASEFYAQHPTLVKTIGAGALAVLMSNLSQRH